MSEDLNTPSSEQSGEFAVSSAHATVKREKNYPTTGNEPVALWTFCICAVALLAGGSYLGAKSGNFSYDQITVSGYEPTSPGGAGAAAVEDPNDPVVWRKKGKKVYNSCMGCHQGSGLGVPGQYPPLAGSEWVTQGTERFAQIILNGLQGVIQVKGTAYSGRMEPQVQLSDEQIAQVMSYVRYEWGNGIEERVTTEGVAQARAAHEGKKGKQTVADLAPADAYLPGDVGAGDGAEEGEGAESAESATE